MGQNKEQLHGYRIFGNISRWNFLVINIIAICYTQLISTRAISSYAHSGYSWKNINFSSDPLKYLISLQLVLNSVHKHIPSGTINARSRCRTLFSKGLNVSPRPEISA